MIEIRNPGPSIGPTEIRRLEETIGTALPESYRHFLMRYNGGRPSPDIIYVPDVPWAGTDVKMFFGIGRALETQNIMWFFHLLKNNSFYKEFYPSRVIRME